jgi:hypothetical protein
MEDRIVNGVVDRLFSRLSPEAEGNSTPVSLPSVIQRIISNPVLQDVEGELRNRFNTHNSQQSTPTVARNPQQSSTTTVPGSTSSAPAATPVHRYNPTTSYGRPRSSGSGRRRKRTIQNIFKDEPAEKITYKDFVFLGSNVTTTPRGKERSKLEKEGFVVHAVPLKQSQTEEEIEEVVNEIFAHKLSQTSTGPKRCSSPPVLNILCVIVVSCYEEYCLFPLVSP